MSKTKHTPGPWRFYDTYPNDGEYAEVFGPWGPDYHDRIPVCGPNAIPDARLIAAAPDLLAALREAIRYLHGYEGEMCCDSGHGALLVAQQAIAKAEGRILP